MINKLTSLCTAHASKKYSQCLIDAFILKHVGYPIVSVYFYIFSGLTYHGNHAAGTDAVAHAHSHQPLVVRVLAPSHQHLVTHVVGTFVHHEAAALHPTGVAAAQVGGELSTVTAGLIGATLKIPVLIEDDLKIKQFNV